MKGLWFKHCFCIVILTALASTANCRKPFYLEESSRPWAIQEKHYLPYREKHTVEGYREFIAKYPGNIFIPEAEMWIDFIQFTPYEQLGTVEGYKAFKQKHPNNRYIDRADAYLGQIEAKRYEKLDTIDGYREFLTQYPGNNFAGLAKRRLQELEFRELHRVLQEKYGFDLLQYRLALRRLKKDVSQKEGKRGEVDLGDFECFASVVTCQGKEYFHTHLIYPLTPYYSEASPREAVERFFDPVISKALVYLDGSFSKHAALDGFSFDVSTSADYFYGDRTIHIECYFPKDQVALFVTGTIDKNNLFAHAIIVAPGKPLR